MKLKNHLIGVVSLFILNILNFGKGDQTGFTTGLNSARKDKIG
jgi:hypothetical protein